MKATTFFVTLFTLLFTLVLAVPQGGPNAQRLARGLPPLPPVRRSPTFGSPRPAPSPVPTNQCSAGAKVQCCYEVTTARNPLVSILLEALGIDIPADTPIGKGCKAGSDRTQCFLPGMKKLCCNATGPAFGLFAVGCTPYPGSN
ncbi:hypothetical protein CC1G_05161 [Coprinopsis cinerea okayama7|uniref:Hydrophobin n=1 Tax=Coprinopsis cinerea (strain Okayama-7 / 130 / ATCC MYA-4618 / FGSC 9003) TaxID=240176 RepID=A8NG29_COPC7|nr:hypothetical protein CC1G_05161 [Coprinopsis cinerea okayama7\|eukprot:XP_001833461.2 hypothetical protein CC1G_05161 [Coprinopsis cinerea okayama7\